MKIYHGSIDKIEKPKYGKGKRYNDYGLGYLNSGRGISYDPDCFWNMFINCGLSRRFEIGDVSVVTGKSGPELAYMVLHDVEHKNDYPVPIWREERSDLYWSGWILAYFQWHEKF